jgi:hypothetical protein
LMQRVGQAEMTIAMHSAEFGAISIRTSNIKDQIAAEVSLDHTELSKALLSHLPDMQSKLNGDRPLDLRITSASSSAQSFTQSNSHGNSSDSGGQRSPRPQGMQQLYSSTSAASVPLAVAMPTTQQPTNSSARLDVRA